VFKIPILGSLESAHPESYDVYAGLTFHTDVKGFVIKKINNGLHEISKYGMRSYFKKLFRDNVINQVLGKSVPRDICLKCQNEQQS
jgi:hypothetical protein